jgi:hypothetical protein
MIAICMVDPEMTQTRFEPRSGVDFSDQTCPISLEESEYPWNGWQGSCAAMFGLS